MESAQTEMMSVLLKRLLSAGLISRATYLRAEDLVHSTALPRLFSVCPEEEGAE